MTPATVAELVAMIQALADDLEAEINDRYAGTEDMYANEKRRYDRDMSSVIEARRLIERVW